MIFPVSTRRRIEACIDAGIKFDGHHWYDSALLSIKKYVGNDAEKIEEMAAYLAIASPRVQVSRSIKIAKHFFETGKKLPGTMSAVFERLQSFKADPLNFHWSPKVFDFYRAIMADVESIVVDIHISRVFGFADGYPMATTKKAVGIRTAIKKYIANRSQDSPYKPRDLQAIIWCGWLRFQGLEPGKLEL